jgi:integrase
MSDSEAKAPKRRLTKAMVERMPAHSKIWDTDVRGFFVRKQTARPVFYLKYSKAGRQRWMAIGELGAPWTVETARNEAQRLWGEVAAGGDPAAERDRAKTIPTMDEMADRFMEYHAAAKLKPGTVRNYEYQIRLYVKPKLGKLRADAVTPADVSNLQHSLRTMPYEANRVLALVSKMFSWAELQGYRPRGTNPCVGIERFREHRRERFLSQEELARVGEALADAEASGRETPWAVAAVRLLIFTGARLSEVVTLKWEHVDLERGLLLLPDSKTGKKAIHLSAPASAILAAVPRVDGNPYVMAGVNERAHISDLGARWRRIRERAGVPDVRVHDLRHSFASVAAARGGSLPMIGRLLGHTHTATTARYAHLGNDPIRDLNEAAGAALASALEPGNPSADVVPFKAVSK